MDKITPVFHGIPKKNILVKAKYYLMNKFAGFVLIEYRRNRRGMFAVNG
tara:strand:+ start:251 stop:397 length:147 start_codon:yes stop_codon:yes gene_type:complete